MLELAPFNFDTQDYTGQINYDTLHNCNSVMFINKGNTPVTVNGVILMPSPLNVAPGDRYAGESITFGGNIGEIYMGQIYVRFPSPIGTDPFVTVVQKYYINK